MATPDVSAELRDLCARRDIDRLLATYIRGLDRMMPELLTSVFHDDAYYDAGTYTGNAAGFVEFAMTFLGTMKRSHHHLGQALIEVSDTRARGEVYFTAFHRVVIDGADTDLFIAGRYVDQYADRGSGWKISHRCLIVDWARTEPAADAFVSGTPQLVLGARGKDDFSNRRNWPA